MNGPSQSQATNPVVSEISATEQPWNSATTLFIARKLQQIAGGRTISVLDMGCGEGRLLRSFLPYGHDLFGYDLPENEDLMRQKLEPVFGRSYSHHIRVMKTEREIPFESQMFDVIYANQVFEHVRFLDRMFEECVRVLKPGGTLITLFPVATYPLEGHVLIPFAHWVPPGAVRRAYLYPFLALGIGRRLGLSAREASAVWDWKLRNQTFYRFMNEIEALISTYFESCDVETRGYVRAKIDLLRVASGRSSRLAGWLLNALDSPLLGHLVTYGFNAAFCARGPRSPWGPESVTQGQTQEVIESLGQTKTYQL
jgi:SAM-dependent methyltransferase